MKFIFRSSARRYFLYGCFTGIISTVLFGTGLIWWTSSAGRSTLDSALYDACLVDDAGNTVVCDATMRLIERERTAETAMREQASKLLAAGFTKREVVKWAGEKGFVGSQLSEAVGISLEDLRAGKY